MSLKLDASGFQCCDDETTSTSYFGGSIVVNGVTYYCSGSDRSGLECLDIVCEKYDLDDDQRDKLYELVVFDQFVGEIMW